MIEDRLPRRKKSSRGRHSRFGCRNCKLRKLKCDETRPQCTRCRTYGVVCNFEFNVSDLLPLPETDVEREVVKISVQSSPQPAVSNGIWTDDGTNITMLDVHDQELFNRFRFRTLLTLGGDTMVNIYENHMLQLAFSCPFLMHGSLAVAAVHDRYLGISPSHRRSVRESYHWSQCTILFNKWLSQQPIKEEHKDPLWATAGTLAILTFASVNCSSPVEAWPLGPADSTDLEWLKLGLGKMALWNLVQPLRPNSRFRNVMETFAHTQQPLPEKGIDGIPTELANLCRLDEASTAENNPYFTAVHGLSRLLNTSKEEMSQGKVMMVTRYLHGDFGAYLAKKDLVALVLLCVWYIRARESIWWLNMRIRYELPAIYTYLQRHHGENHAVQALIPWGGRTVNE